MRTTVRIATAVALLAGLAGAAHAQSQTASITAQAIVQQPLNVTAGNNLDFGNVLPGVPKSVAATDAGAGTFRIQGQSSFEVALTYTLPTNLVDASLNNLLIGTWSGLHNGTNSTAGATSFSPGGVANVDVYGTGDIWVFLGATVTPGVNQVAGTYTGTVQLDVAYTGN
ncbi:MAG: hypothetical protein ACREMH_06320 [Gemmatimonadales bacterium]